MQQAMIIINPASGKADARDYIRSAEEILQSTGYQVTIHETAGEGMPLRSACRHAAGAMIWWWPSAETAPFTRP